MGWRALWGWMSHDGSELGTRSLFYNSYSAQKMAHHKCQVVLANNQGDRDHKLEYLSHRIVLGFVFSGQNKRTLAIEHVLSE